MTDKPIIDTLPSQRSGGSTQVVLYPDGRTIVNYLDANGFRRDVKVFIPYDPERK